MLADWGLRYPLSYSSKWTVEKVSDFSAYLAFRERFWEWVNRDIIHNGTTGSGIPLPRMAYLCLHYLATGLRIEQVPHLLDSAYATVPLSWAGARIQAWIAATTCEGQRASGGCVTVAQHPCTRCRLRCVVEQKCRGRYMNRGDAGWLTGVGDTQSSATVGKHWTGHRLLAEAATEHCSGHGQPVRWLHKTLPSRSLSRSFFSSIAADNYGNVLPLRLKQYHKPTRSTRSRASHFLFYATTCHLLTVLFVSQLPKYGIPNYRLTCSLKRSLHLDVIWRPTTFTQPILPSSAHHHHHHHFYCITNL